MKKLRMELESLAVDSFETGAVRAVFAAFTEIPCSAIDACPSALACPTILPDTTE